MIDRFDVRRARSADGLLAPFVEIGVLDSADVHVSRCIAALCGDTDEQVLLAAAFAVRAPRLGHVHVDLATIRETVSVDSDEPVDLEALPWPEVEPWVGAVAASDLTGVGEEDPLVAPLRLLGTRLHLDRLWRDERAVANDVIALAADAPVTDDAVLGDGLARLFADDLAGRQALAAATAVLSRFAVIAGGPGTGKTTTVARVLALLTEQARAADEPDPLIALAAPTGKAAARLHEAVQEETAELNTDQGVRSGLEALEATTLHRLLGWRPGTASRFRHDRTNRLPHDVVVVDESSMVSLSLMARLVEAVRPDARLILVGDPQQLVAIEAGAVLSDVVEPSATGLRMTPGRRERLAALTGTDVTATDPADGARIPDSVVVLDRVHRFGEGIASLARAIREGDADATINVLRNAPEGVRWIEQDAADSEEVTEFLRTRSVAAGSAVIDAARAGDASGALRALAEFRVLCAHRRGPYGVATWAARIEDWLAATRPGLRPVGSSRPFAGQTLLVTQNDRELRLYNGDTGVVVADGPRLRVAFERAGGTVLVSPARISAFEPLLAMTIHKAQGSQVTSAAVLLPEASSRLLTRELLYTAVTRSREQIVLVGQEAAVRSAVSRPAARATGLALRL